MDDALNDDILRLASSAQAEAIRLAGLADEVSIRLRFGLSAFNAASMVALISAAGAAPGVLQSLGVSNGESFASVCVFAVGTIAAGASIFLTQQELQRRSGYAAARAVNLGTRAAAAAYGNAESFEETATHEVALFGLAHKRSTWAVKLQHVAGLAWASGLLSIICATAQ
jgi:hypothetical protein